MTDCAFLSFRHRYFVLVCQGRPRSGDIRRRASALDPVVFLSHARHEHHLYWWVSLYVFLVRPSKLTLDAALLGLVALRIWRMNRAIMTFVDHSYRPIVFLVLESGMVYSATLLTLLILYKTGSWFQYVLLDAVSPLSYFLFQKFSQPVNRYPPSSVWSSP